MTTTIDVTDATFEEALERSADHPVVVDLWAPWCGPCRTLGPILERVIDATDGAVELVKVNVDENPRISATFQVQSIPAVYALKDRKVVDGFIGALGEAAVSEFVARLAPALTAADELVAKGDEESLRKALELEPDHPRAIVQLAEHLVGTGQGDEALALLGRIPENPDTRRIAAQARTGEVGADADLERRLDELLERVKDDENARQEFVDLLELLGAEHPRTAEYRKALASRLY